MVSRTFSSGERVAISTRLRTQRKVHDVLLGAEIDSLQAAHPHTFYHYPVLSQPPPNGWVGGRGWVTSERVREALAATAARRGTALHREHERRAALVCGTDGFVDTVCGDKVRLPP